MSKSIVKSNYCFLWENNLQHDQRGKGVAEEVTIAQVTDGCVLIQIYFYSVQGRSVDRLSNLFDLLLSHCLLSFHETTSWTWCLTLLMICTRSLDGLALCWPFSKTNNYLFSNLLGSVNIFVALIYILIICSTVLKNAMFE